MNNSGGQLLERRIDRLPAVAAAASAAILAASTAAAFVSAANIAYTSALIGATPIAAFISAAVTAAAMFATFILALSLPDVVTAITASLAAFILTASSATATDKPIPAVLQLYLYCSCMLTANTSAI